MSIEDKIKDDTEKDYLHPGGKPAVAPKTSEERANLAKAGASTELVAEISKDSDGACAKKGDEAKAKAKAKGAACETDDDDTLKLEKV
jgi:hypothetical protein